VVKYLSHDSLDTTLTVYMPYYANQDLKTYLLKHPLLDFPTRIRCFLDILAGMLELHSRFIIHRDMKAENIFVDQNGRCLVGDLGIATRAAGGVASRLGTVGLQAPEVYSEQEYDEKVDMWAVGIIAYQLFNRQRDGQLAYPFGKPQEMGKKILFRGGGDVVYDSYRKATLKFTPNDADLPAPLSQMIAHMLKNDPSERLSWV
jgi:serine/threonine protein kinase